MTIIQRLMTNAVPILVFAALVLIFSGFLEYYSIAVSADLSNKPHLMQMLAGAVSHSLSNAAWPFIGAAIVWTLQRRTEAAE